MTFWFDLKLTSFAQVRSFVRTIVLFFSARIFYSHCFEHNHRFVMSVYFIVFHPKAFLKWDFYSILIVREISFFPGLNNDNTSWNASMRSHIFNIATEKGLDTQKYQCFDCAAPIGGCFSFLLQVLNCVLFETKRTVQKQSVNIRVLHYSNFIKRVLI